MSDNDKPRLIEVAFPLKQASLDSVHEKNVRHGHISTLHIWPARRPLAACRAALIATLLPDPGTPEKRRELIEKIGGRVVEKIERKKMPSGKIKEIVKEETVGGILHWGRETENKETLDWFRAEIKKAYGGRAPKVLDPFAGGGAIPLEAMRLGCEATAIDINPVAWFLLKCTLEYPQKLAGQKRPLPEFILKDRDFMEAFFKAQGLKGATLRTQLEKLGFGEDEDKAGRQKTFDVGMAKVSLDADLAWHIRAWGKWVLAEARKDLAKFYPTYADFDLPAASRGSAAQAGPLDKLPIPRDTGTFCVYVLHCSDGSFYIGQTNDLKRRFREHEDGAVSWTTPRRPVELLHWEEFASREEAVKREHDLKTGFGRTWIKREFRAGRLKAQQYKGLRLVPLKEDGLPAPDGAVGQAGTLDIDVLNAEFDETYLANKQNPRWIAKPTVAYLWARTVKCKNCRATIPLLKTRWLCKKSSMRVRLTMEASQEALGVVFGVQDNVPVKGGNAAQRRENDKRLGQGTMTRSGASCPCCEAIMTMKDIRHEGLANRLGCTLTAVVFDGLRRREYRPPTIDEIRTAEEAELSLDEVFASVPFGIPREPLAIGRTQGNSGFRVLLYGMNTWDKLFSPRQLLALGRFVGAVRCSTEEIHRCGYSSEWTQAVSAYLTLGIDRLADRSSAVCRPDPTPTQSGVINTFSKFALPMSWDFIEGVTIQASSGGFLNSLEWIAKVLERSGAMSQALPPDVSRRSALKLVKEGYDVILTDPPYYDAIAYADLMDFFYVWLRRSLHGVGAECDEAFSAPLSPKWDSSHDDGELIDDPSRFEGDRTKSKAVYEEGMFGAFSASCRALKPEGRLVIVFAHKHPDAWETLVGALVRAGLIVDASWPIQTEMPNRARALGTASLASSVWLVCKRRPTTAKLGWDNQVVEQMRARISERLHDYWDAGIRGPDFIWAATGPALEAYSKYPVVKKANAPGKLMEVSEFLRHVRRIVVDFVVGRVLSHNGEAESVSGLDDITTYYLLHRHDFKMEDAPIGACILYAISCGLSDKDLADRHDILARSGKKGASAEDDGEAAGLSAGNAQAGGDEDTGKGGGSTVKLKTWKQRTRSGMGYDPAWDAAKARRDHEHKRPKLFDDEMDSQAGTPVPQCEVPLIDQVHRLMHLWKAGDVSKVDSYLDTRGLRRSQLFAQVLQAVIELAEQGSEERSLMESISNHLRASGMAPVSLFDGSKQEED